MRQASKLRRVQMSWPCAFAMYVLMDLVAKHRTAVCLDVGAEHRQLHSLFELLTGGTSGAGVTTEKALLINYYKVHTDIYTDDLPTLLSVKEAVSA